MSRVICLEGPSDEELIGRILGGRRTSKATGEVYHLENDPPPSPRSGRTQAPSSGATTTLRRPPGRTLLPTAGRQRL